MVKELNHANQIEIYLYKPTQDTEYKQTFSCTKLYFKADQNQLFRIEGLVESYGSKSVKKWKA